MKAPTDVLEGILVEAKTFLLQPVSMARLSYQGRWQASFT
tara:strand:- start:1147 stop:1266 length:120 start_codon:yes stop_codon:yes gene_type:complete